MMLNVIAFFNKKLKCFTTPQFVDLEPEKAAIQLKRHIIAVPEKGVQYRFLEMYFIGTFNDETGEYNASKKFLLDADAIVEEVLKDVSVDETSDDETSSSEAQN